MASGDGTIGDMEEKRVELSGGELVYLEIGNGPPLVFFHGAFATPRAYIPLLSLLAKHFRVIAPTHPGHGDSFATGDGWQISDFVGTYKEFVKKLAIESPLLVGHSFGATLALLLAAQGVGKRVVAMDAPGLPFAITPRGWVRAKMKEAEYIMDHLRDQKKLTQALSAAATLLYTARRHPEEISWLMETLPSLDLRDEFCRIAKPVYIFWGEDDGIVPLTVGKIMFECISGATFTLLQGLGHNYPILDPDRTYAEIKNILGV